ncbi:MAG TPA: zinc ribbon domain-containing protein, partial [Methylomirabilota bacterium]|nr:zinc ribbon domain-containing protein [Methylomirabilota bacterium]
YRQEKETNWSHIIPTQIEFVSIPRSYDYLTPIYQHFSLYDFMPVDGQEGKFYQEADLLREIEPELQNQRAIFLKLLADLKQVMHILSEPENQIMLDSGVVRPRKRKQINYHTHPAQTLTHPRKTIMHPQRTYQDVKNDVANQLSGLPNFTARVKLDEIFQQNPGKKCLSCKLLNNLGAKFCSKCVTKLPIPNEYTIETIKPTGYIGSQQLKQRMQGIQARNRHDGYCRSKQDVEKEIINRQTGCSGGSAPAQLQQPQQPSPQQARHARQVPVQGHCPTCNATNPRGSKFCNNCGSPI